jgi:hypothetical protein
VDDHVGPTQGHLYLDIVPAQILTIRSDDYPSVRRSHGA